MDIWRASSRLSRSQGIITFAVVVAIRTLAILNKPETVNLITNGSRHP